MENSTSSLDKNLLISIILPILFILGFYTYYQIDLYYSNKLLQEINLNLPKNKVTNYKMIYKIDNEFKDYPLIPKSELETLPFGTTTYQDNTIYEYRPKDLNVYESCSRESVQIVPRISYLDEVGFASDEKPYINVNHYALDRVFIYDFTLGRSYQINCAPLENYGLSLEKYYDNYRSPDGLVNFEIEESSILYNDNSNYEFPYLRQKALNLKTTVSDDGFYYKKILVNGKEVPAKSLILDEANNITYDDVNYNGKLHILGWAN